MDCCSHSPDAKECIRKKDNKIFKLPRKFSKDQCDTKIKGFSMKSSCAPYIYCKNKNTKTKYTSNKIISKDKKSQKTKKTFFFNPDNPKNSFDVYIDKNPNDTIPIKYKTVQDVKNTIKKLEKLYKKKLYSHKRIWQVGMIMRVRLGIILKHKEKFSKAKMVKQRYELSDRYFKFLGERTKKKDADRYKMVFKI